MAAGDIDDPLTNIPNVVVVDQSAATAAPGAGYARVESVNGILGVRVGSGAWVPLVSLSAGLLDGLTEKETPAAGDWLLLQDEADSSAIKKVDVDNLPGGEGNGPLEDAYLCYRDVKSSNTYGGTFNSGAWRVRDLTEETADTAGIGALASNQITLPAGTYRCRITCPAMGVATHVARLYDTTGAAVLLVGSAAQSSTGAGSYANTLSEIVGTFTLAQESVLQIEHQCFSSQADYGFGPAHSFGDCIFTIAEFWRFTA